MMDNNKVKKVIQNINKLAENTRQDNINLMEVCGTHTNSIAKYGIKNVISNKVKLLSGPGCPVCVTNEDYIDAAVQLASEGITVITFGDLVRVKGHNCDLLTEKSKGRDVRIIYSISEIINIAKAIYPKEIVFLAVGFETTAPLIAALIKQTYTSKINNLSFLTSIKIMLPILEKILNTQNRNIDGIICPGNVAVISGGDSFKFIYEKYKVPSVICGFEAEDILGGIYFLVKYINKKNKGDNEVGFENLYRRFVSPKGNIIAKRLLQDIFKVDDVVWRGIGNVENSALIIEDKYSKLDAVNRFKLKEYFNNKNHVVGSCRCRCGDVLMGNIYPFQCELFKKTCSPENPYGPCMVSQEGACSTYYKYNQLVIRKVNYNK
ncbi:hydrogenase formation protein HypD [Clostridium sp. MB40-C1]|uniref:hydrogenase formation protein HypD n=1 Tax=Clostridium sp. MB40-C1 TaxID=3070996 RepID=UPI0027DF7F37|nr:hydrogenase formation protein HypD [Clostridium sp. MB40-C1]WMJ80209.1 hydrogenase formation protein HypD [Clostridium sp. MB40-C1]